MPDELRGVVEHRVEAPTDPRARLDAARTRIEDWLPKTGVHSLVAVPWPDVLLRGLEGLYLAEGLVENTSADVSLEASALLVRYFGDIEGIASSRQWVSRSVRELGVQEPVKQAALEVGVDRVRERALASLHHHAARVLRDGRPGGARSRVLWELWHAGPEFGARRGDPRRAPPRAYRRYDDTLGMGAHR